MYKDQIIRVAAKSFSNQQVMLCKLCSLISNNSAVTDEGLEELKELLKKDDKPLGAFFKYAVREKAKISFAELINLCKRASSQGVEKFKSIIDNAPNFKDFLLELGQLEIVDNKVCQPEVDAYVNKKLEDG